MKGVRLFALILFCCGWACVNKQRATSDSTPGITVRMFFSITQDYCGGARPSEEILQELNTPRPLVNEKFFIRKGSINDPKSTVVAELLTDSTGAVSVQLPIGKYCIVREWKRDYHQIDFWKNELQHGNQLYDPIDVECLDNWIKNPDWSFEVVEGLNDSQNFSCARPCAWNSIPCARYIGPMPQ